MQVRFLEPDASIGVQRGDAVVCIPVYGGHDHFVGCLRSVLAHTPADVPVLICDDASPDSRSEELVRALGAELEQDRELLYLRREHNLGFPANVNGAFAIAAPADVVVLNSDCIVADGWLDGLHEAAYVDSTVATATALTNNGSIVSVPDRFRPSARLPEPWGIDDAAAAVRARSLRIRPRLPVAVGHCMYIRRSALELVGDFDLAFSPGYGEEVDFSQRCLRTGLCHVLADDVLVLHYGGASFAQNGQPSPVQAEHEQLLAARYPYYHQSIWSYERGEPGPLWRALGVARRALIGMSVAVDARVLSGPMTGTQLHVLELIAAIARHSAGLRVTAIVPEELPGYAAQALALMPDVGLVTRRQIKDDEFSAVDLVHRPFQVDNHEDLSFLAGLGERLIVTNQDLIGYRNPSYFSSFRTWDGYRKTTRLALAVADRVVFFSGHAREDALAEDLVEPARASVVHIGVDHNILAPAADPTPPPGLRLPDSAQAILCIGTDFRHKNRLFALRVLEQLQSRHGWDGYLLLVGPPVARGSSVPDEEELLMLRPQVAARVYRLAAVGDAEKAWLYRRAALAFYPTVHEGFGLIPFEAADHDIPCMWAPGTSLSEILPDAAATVVPWNAEQTADVAIALLRDQSARDLNVATIRTAGASLTWQATASRLIEVYEQTCDAPASPASALARGQDLMGGTFSEDAIRLVGPGGALPSDVERPLLALATHPQISAPMFRAMKLGYRASFRLRRWRGDDGADAERRD